MRISAVLFFLFLFIGCSRESTISSRPYEGELKNKGNLTIYFDCETINSGFHSLRYFKDETTYKEYLTLLALELNQIQFYELNTGKLEKSIPVSANADSYVIVNCDSIFVFFQTGTSFHLCNSKGKLLNIFDFGYLMKKSEGHFVEQSAFFNDPQYKNGKLYLRVVNNENYYTESGVLVLKFNNGGLESGVMTALYPDWFAKEYENYNMSLPVFAVKGDTVLMSYEVEHDVFYYQERGFVEKRFARSDHLPTFTKYSPKEFKSNIEYQMKCGMFTGFAYDEYHHLFYRCAQLEVPKKERKKPNNLMKQEFSLCIFDESMQKLNEFVFDSKDYYVTNVIPTSGGFLASKRDWEKVTENDKSFFRLTYTLFEYIR